MGKSLVGPRKYYYNIALNKVDFFGVFRLEPIAAVIGAKLAVMIRHELEQDLKCIVLWTDATIVLCYI